MVYCVYKAKRGESVEGGRGNQTHEELDVDVVGDWWGLPCWYGDRLLVDNAVIIAQVLGWSEAVTFDDRGSRDKYAGTGNFRGGCLEKRTDIAIGNVIGSNIFNLFGCFRINGDGAPVETNQINSMDMLVMLGTSLLLLPSCGRDSRSRGEGVVLPVIYIAFIHCVSDCLIKIGG